MPITDRTAQEKPTSSNSSRFCDVVMKGGITSGVVYPRAVVELSKRFRLKNIGGTSAGAIAAAGAAAAQYRELKTGSRAGFEIFEKLPEFLGSDSGLGTKLYRLFQPQPKTQLFFEAFVAVLEAKNFQLKIRAFVWGAIKAAPFAALLGALPGVICFLAAAGNPQPMLHSLGSILAIAIAVTGAAVAAAIKFSVSFGIETSTNFFGLCTGMSPDAESEALTPWLTRYLNELAGLDPDGAPLTFGQLWAPELQAGTEPVHSPEIRLEMFTTCLTKGRPFRLPFRQDAILNENVFFYKKSDFEQLFPASVVRWMEEHPRLTRGDWQKYEDDYLPLPDPWNLPLVVATRLSLSFPILLSAVPLYAYDRELKKTACEEGENEVEPKLAAPPTRLSCCWFSDGGICSNFPVHFFDAPVPRWPTFGINLVDVASGTSKADLSKPSMPVNNRDGVLEPMTHLHPENGLAGLMEFVATIISTMQNWSDNTLSRMPGYRDRISPVALTPEEGGLNLRMPMELISELSDRGVSATEEFISRFADDAPKMGWDNHRWLRFRAMMASTVETLESFDKVYGNGQPGDVPYAQWVAEFKPGRSGGAPSYPYPNEDHKQAVIKTVEKLREVAAIWKDLDSATQTPRPRPELRPRPRI